MADFIDCKYEENLVDRLERISQEFLTLPVDGDISTDDTDILNENTRVLNIELNRFRKLRNDLAKSSRITSSVKAKIKDQFIPNAISQQYNNTNVKIVQDVIDFSRINSQFFTNPFTEERILEVVSNLDPLSFRTFDSEFPSISLRIRSGPISSTEVNSLIRENGLDPKIFASQVRSSGNSIFRLLERFLSALGIGIGIMGSFCALVENVFALTKGQRDLTGNPAKFLENFTNVLGLINPQAGQVLGQVQELISLVQEAQQNTTDIASNLQNAFGILASAFGIVMNFIPLGSPESTTNGSIELEWNFEGIRDAITAQNPLFLVIVEETNKPLGDINQDGIMNGNDAISLQTYIDDAADISVTNYVENVLVPFLNRNASTYSEFVNFPSAQEPDSNLSSVIDDFSSVVVKFGAIGGGGDFGLGQIIQILSIATGIISSIQGLISGSRPVNIQGLFQQLDQIVDLGSDGIQGMFADFSELSQDYNETVEDALKEAEENSVDDPAKTAEINEKNQESLKENYSKALETTGEAAKNLGPRLIQAVNQIKNGISSLAAVGVLENLDQQLSSVIDQSATQAKSKIDLFAPTSLDNGYHFNMGSSYGKMSGIIAGVEDAVSDDTTEGMKNSVKGMIAQSSEKYRQKNKEEVEFVALRFCKLAGEIERMYAEITKPLENITSEYKRADQSLSAVGNDTTLRAIRAGAIRYDTQTRLQAMQQAGGIEASFARDFGTGRNFPAAQGTLPGIGYGPLPPLPAEFANLPRDSDVRNTIWNGLITYNLGGDTRELLRNAGLSERFGWDGIFYHGGRNDKGIDMLRRFVLLAAEWRKLGKSMPLRVNSAYRPRSRTPNGGLSYHARGMALDVGVRGSDQRQFAELARSFGFGGIGIYSSFVHIDTGPVRQW